MIPPELPDNEKQRQAAVEKYELLDTLPEQDYDNITSLMSYICDTPISLISLLDNDRNFLISHIGIPFSESPRSNSFCGHTINSDDPITLIEDARKDERFFDNPLVTEHNAVFYAGVPLVNPDGYKLGTLCVYDTKPRQLTPEQLNALQMMSLQVVNLLEQRYQNLQLMKFQQTLEKRNYNLEKFASIVSHDLKSPLANILTLTELLENSTKGTLNNESLEYLQHLKNSSHSLRQYIDGLLEFYRSDDLLLHNKETIQFKDLMNELTNMTALKKGVQLSYQTTTTTLLLNKAALMQILINLITNAVKYNSKEIRSVTINLTDDDKWYKFEVIDNADGIPADALNQIFDLFFVANNSDRHGESGTGIGLATVKKILDSLGGEIAVDSEEGVGSTFTFSLPKP